MFSYKVLIFFHIPNVAGFFMNPTNSIPPSSPFTQGSGITPVYGATDSSEHRSNTYVLAMYDGFFLGGQSAKTWGGK